jgi:hypothetical protein
VVFLTDDFISGTELFVDSGLAQIKTTAARAAAEISASDEGSARLERRFSVLHLQHRSKLPDS